MNAVVVVVALTALLCAVQHLVRRAGAWLLWLAYGVVPLALTGYWVRTNDLGPFVWVKLYSVLFCVCYGTGVRDTALGSRSWARGALTVLLGLNVLEAVAVDCLDWGVAHALNVVAGLGLVAALPRSLDAAQIERGGHVHDIRFHGTPLRWIVGYSVWNWTFVYLNYPALAGQHVAVLLSCLIVGAVDPRLWLQARACTLGAHLMAMVTFPGLVRSGLDTSHWSDPRIGLAAATLALLLAAGCVRVTSAATVPVRGERFPQPRAT